MELKYIVTSHNDFAIFSPSINHNDMARVLNGKPVGAGSCNIRQQADSNRVNVHCYGQSLSLHIGSREEDEEIINKNINHNYD